jgi:hypothetical protein
MGSIRRRLHIYPIDTQIVETSLAYTMLPRRIPHDPILQRRRMLLSHMAVCPNLDGHK